LRLESDLRGGQFGGGCRQADFAAVLFRLHDHLRQSIENVPLPLRRWPNYLHYSRATLIPMKTQFLILARRSSIDSDDIAAHLQQGMINNIVIALRIIGAVGRELMTIQRD